MRNIQRFLAASALLVGASGLGAGVAHAAPSLAVSDQIRFAGLAVGAPGSHTFTIRSRQCHLLSDSASPAATNEPAVPCVKTAQFTIHASGVAVGGATVTSPDGTIRWVFTITGPIPDTTIRNMSGTGVEIDRPGLAEVASPPYAAVIHGTVSVVPVPGGLSISG